MGLLPNFLSDDPEIRKINASKAASKSAKFPATDGKKCIKFHTETERRIFLENNPKFKSGGRPYKRKDKTPAIWMNDGNKNRVIKQPEISDYLGRGWVRGRK
jgi:hypothetical protein